MERNREARRGSMAAVNGGGLSRRRQRSTGLRDSPEEDGAMETPETSRLRERTSKRDRERDRSSRSKRRRGERMMHGGGREEGEDSSEESIDEEEEDEEEEQSVSLRAPPPPPSSSPAPSSSSASQNAQLRRSLPAAPAKTLRPPLPVWKVADEVMGVSVPRKARSASGKRSLDSWAPGGGGGGVDPIHRQSSTSPARPSTASPAHASPSSSNASVRKKLKPVGGATQRPPKSSKPSPAQEDIEFEVAEALFEMTRQFQCPTKQENHRVDSKDANGSISEGKSGASSPISQPSAQPQRNFFSNQGTTAPKRKRPRPVKFDDESPTSPASSTALPATSVPSTTKLESGEQQQVKADDSSPRADKNPASLVVENGGCLPDLAVSQAGTEPVDAKHDLVAKPENSHVSDSKVLPGEADGMDRSGVEMKEEAGFTQKEAPPSDLDVNVEEPKSTKAKGDLTADKLREEKFSIDLMAPPPGKMSPEREDYVPVHRPVESEVESVSKIGDSRREEVKPEAKQESEEIVLEERKGKPILGESNLKKHSGKERAIDLQLDLEKPEREELGVSKDLAQKQQSKTMKVDSKLEKAVPPAVTMPLAMPVSGWPGNLPPLGYMGQIPSIQAVLPMDASSGSSKPLNFLLPQRLKRCATHCLIAQTIRHHQQLAKINPFWSAAASTMQLYGAKAYNLNALPPSESAVLGNSLQGNLPGRSISSLQDKSSSPVIGGYLNHPTRENSSTVNNSLMEAAQRKQTAHPTSANNMPPGATFIFPLKQHTAGVATANRAAAPKSTSGGNAAPSSVAANSGMASSGMGGPAAAVNFNYASLPPNETQYLAVLPNNGYPFPIPTHVGASPYRGALPAHAMSFYGGSFYPSQMIHPSQLQQQPVPQQPPQSQQGHLNASTSTGSSSSQKHQQHLQRVPGGGPAPTGVSSQNFSTSKQGQHLSETGCEDSLLITDRASQAQKSIYGHSFPMPLHPQNFALISPAAAAAAAAVLGGGGGQHSEKQSAAQHQGMKVELTPSPAFAVSFASLSGAAAAATAAVPPGLDFSAMAQNHAVFQSFPEAARHGYQMAAAAQAAQQHKKAHQPEDGKSVGESLNATMASEEERKMMAPGKGPVSGSQQSLTFSRQESEVPISSILGNSIMDSSSRTLNLISVATNGVRTSSRTPSAAPTTSPSATAVVGSPNSQQQQQQQLIQLQKHQQQRQLQHQHQLTSRAKSSATSNNASVYTERLPVGSTVAKFPSTLSGFPQVIPGGGSPSQHPSWKSTSRSVAATVPPPSAAPSSAAKGQLPQQQSRVTQQSSTPAHQTQISFGANSLKMAVSPSGPSSMPSLSSANSIVVGSFPNPVNKSTGGGSPQASYTGKSVPPVSTTLPLPQQPSDKNSISSSGPKPSPASNRNMPSILGQPHIAPISNSSSSSSSSSKQLQQGQLQQKTPYPQAQFFFSNAYMPSQSAQSNVSAAASFYPRHPSELHPQQSQQHNSNPASMGVLSLCSSALTLSAAPVTNDPAKAMAAAASIKGIPSPGLLQLPSQPASAGPHPFISAAGASFPYFHAMQSVSVKPAEQKPAAV